MKYFRKEPLNSLRYYFPIIVIIFISACDKDTSKKNISTISSAFVSVDDALQFYVIGDWGRNGEERQRDLAIVMDSAAHHVEPDFIISTGDNIYPDGVASVNDP